MTPHGWVIPDRTEYGDFLIAAAGAVPGPMARLVGRCRVEVVSELEPDGITSEWQAVRGGVEVRLSLRGVDPHDLALEFLFCLGQAVWQAAGEDVRDAWVDVLQAELESGIVGEIDEDALLSKRALLEAPEDAALLSAYLDASFAATLAEYVHTGWHDTELREGPGYLPGPAFDARMLWMARLFGGEGPAPEQE